MNPYFVFILVLIAFLLILGVFWGYKGSSTARLFLWSWAVILLCSVVVIDNGYPLYERFAPGAAIMVVFIMLYVLRKGESDDVDTAKTETRRILSEMNARIEGERKYLAGRLHDDVNHKLLEAKMYLKQLRTILEADMTDPDTRSTAQTIVISVQDLVFETYKECRDIIKTTRIEVIESVGLVATLEDMFAQYKAVLVKPRMTFDHNLTSDTEPKGDMAITLYRFIQEAVLNIVKHSKASTATVKVYYRTKNRGYEVEVKDDGIGLLPKFRSSGIGMIDMRERAESLGSELEIVSLPNKGCRIRLKFKRELVVIDRRKGTVNDRRKKSFFIADDPSLMPQLSEVPQETGESVIRHRQT